MWLEGKLHEGSIPPPGARQAIHQVYNPKKDKVADGLLAENLSLLKPAYHQKDRQLQMRQCSAYTFVDLVC